MTKAEREELMGIIRELSYEEREVTLASGRKSNFYFDGKQTTLHARGGLLVGKAFWQEVQQFPGPIHGVGGLTLGADPIATATSVSPAHWRGSPSPPSSSARSRKDMAPASGWRGARICPPGRGW